MPEDWLGPIVGGFVGVAGLFFGWLTSKQTREHAERLARETNEHARRLNEQTDAHARQMEEDRREHTSRVLDNERRQRHIADTYLQIMTTVRKVTDSLARDALSPESEHFDPRTGLSAHSGELTTASALADTFASDEVLRLFGVWRETVALADQAYTRLAALESATQADTTATAAQMWRARLRDLRLRAADARQALVDAAAAEVGARSGRPTT